MDYTYISTAIGDILLAGEDEELAYIGFPEGKGKLVPGNTWHRDDSRFREARVQLDEYFAGNRKLFDLRLRPSGTAFQLKVLSALQQIPYGETRSYKEIAVAIDRPNAVRAVGAANGRNPLPIVIPCHRVIGANGSLTGFGGGLETKKFLLDLERRQQRLDIDG